MARDSLRATLDELKLDPESAKDRPYLEAMLRRLGYTEHEIRQELGPLVDADPTPAAPADAGGDEFGPAREYRLVVPSRDSAFSFAPVSALRQDSPFEAFDRVEFEPAGPVNTNDAVEFTEINEPETWAEAPAAATDQPAAMPEEEFEEAPLQEFQEAPVEQLQADEAKAGGAGVDDVSIDTFGGPSVETQPKTRVRVKRVRARSKQEAESKVASSNRKVIKSIPVDIVERWGPGGKPDDKEAKK
jgi:hypothetical protein